jgi:putative nucleotidyltransferase with HDIG domain
MLAFLYLQNNIFRLNPMLAKTLLLVDDEPNILNALKRLLRRDGYTILTASSGEEGLEVLNKQPVGIIISDYRMPAMTGIEFLSRVKELYPDTIRIVLSGFSDLDTVTDAINQGNIYKFISKPWDDAQLRTVIEEAFENYLLKTENTQLTEKLQNAYVCLQKKNEENTSLINEIVTNSSNGIIVIDQNRTIVFCNPFAMELLKGDCPMLPGDQFGLPFKVEAKLHHKLTLKDGTSLTLEIQCAEIAHDGKPAFLITLHDQTDIDRLHEAEQQAHAKLKASLLQMIKAISFGFEKRDPYSAGHQKKVAPLAMAIAEQMALDEQIIEGIKVAGLVHDIGKIFIPSEILNRPGSLNHYEKLIVQEHTKIGYDIMSSVEFIWPVAEVILQHHENIDGSGYPNQLTGDQMILEAKIIALADRVCAMSEYRPYRDSLSLEEIIALTHEYRGKKFDSDVCDAFLKVMDNGYDLKADNELMF